MRPVLQVRIPSLSKQVRFLKASSLVMSDLYACPCKSFVASVSQYTVYVIDNHVKYLEGLAYAGTLIGSCKPFAFTFFYFMHLGAYC